MTLTQLRRLGMAWMVALAPACANDDPHAIRVDFRQGPQGWTAGFADYPVGEDDFYELVSDYRPLEAPLNTDESALIIPETTTATTCGCTTKAGSPGSMQIGATP